MKWCNQCKRHRREASFYRNRTNRDGLASACKDCNKDSQRRYRDKNRDKRIEYNRQYREKKAIWFRQYKKEHPCVICGEDDPTCIDFHHVQKEHKEKPYHNIAQFASQTYNLDRLKKELEKCVAICSNCHRKIHAYNWDHNKIKQMSEK